jgi:hypothetical protein
MYLQLSENDFQRFFSMLFKVFYPSFNDIYFKLRLQAQGSKFAGFNLPAKVNAFVRVSVNVKKLNRALQPLFHRRPDAEQ